MSDSGTVVVWEGGTRALRNHPLFGPVVRAVGAVEVPEVDQDRFGYLARAIVYQQLAGAAARTIHGRVTAALGGTVTPTTVQAADPEALREAGLSRNKLAAVLDLAEKVASDELRLDGLEELGDHEVVKRLTRVRGIGPWTAQMFLMFALHRPDVWPVGDLGVRQGYARLHGLDDPVPEEEMRARGDDYRPWRSAAAWYCWRALEVDL